MADNIVSPEVSNKAGMKEKNIVGWASSYTCEIFAVIICTNDKMKKYSR